MMHQYSLVKLIQVEECRISNACWSSSVGRHVPHRTPGEVQLNRDALRCDTIKSLPVTAARRAEIGVALRLAITSIPVGSVVLVSTKRGAGFM